MQHSPGTVGGTPVFILKNLIVAHDLIGLSQFPETCYEDSHICLYSFRRLSSSIIHDYGALKQSIFLAPMHIQPPSTHTLPPRVQEREAQRARVWLGVWESDCLDIGHILEKLKSTKWKVYAQMNEGKLCLV